MEGRNRSAFVSDQTTSSGGGIFFAEDERVSYRRRSFSAAVPVQGRRSSLDNVPTTQPAGAMGHSPHSPHMQSRVGGNSFSFSTGSSSNNSSNSPPSSTAGLPVFMGMTMHGGGGSDPSIQQPGASGRARSASPPSSGATVLRSAGLQRQAEESLSGLRSIASLNNIAQYEPPGLIHRTSSSGSSVGDTDSLGETQFYGSSVTVEDGKARFYVGTPPKATAMQVPPFIAAAHPAAAATATPTTSILTTSAAASTSTFILPLSSSSVPSAAHPGSALLSGSSSSSSASSSTASSATSFPHLRLVPLPSQSVLSKPLAAQGLAAASAVAATATVATSAATTILSELEMAMATPCTPAARPQPGTALPKPALGLGTSALLVRTGQHVPGVYGGHRARDGDVRSESEGEREEEEEEDEDGVVLLKPPQARAAVSSRGLPPLPACNYNSPSTHQQHLSHQDDEDTTPVLEQAPAYDKVMDLSAFSLIQMQIPPHVEQEKAVAVASVEAAARGVQPMGSMPRPRSLHAKLGMLDRAISLRHGNLITYVTLFLRDTLTPVIFNQHLRARPEAINHLVAFYKKARKFTELEGLLRDLGRESEWVMLQYNKDIGFGSSSSRGGGPNAREEALRSIIQQAQKAQKLDPKILQSLKEHHQLLVQQKAYADSTALQLQRQQEEQQAASQGQEVLEEEDGFDVVSVDEVIEPPTVISSESEGEHRQSLLSTLKARMQDMIRNKQPLALPALNIHVSEREKAWAAVHACIATENFAALEDLLLAKNKGTLTNLGKAVRIEKVILLSYLGASKHDQKLSLLLHTLVRLIKNRIERFEAAALIGALALAKETVRGMKAERNSDCLCACLDRVLCWTPQSHSEAFKKGFETRKDLIDILKLAIEDIEGQSLFSTIDQRAREALNGATIELKDVVTPRAGKVSSSLAKVLWNFAEQLR